MKFKVTKEEFKKVAEGYVDGQNGTLGDWIPDFITLEGEPLQDNGTVEKCCEHNYSECTCAGKCHRKENNQNV